MDSITIDGLDEHEFRRSIETMLRQGEADAAAARLRSLLEAYAGDGRILPARFLAVTADDIAMPGWHALWERIAQYDRPHHQITAVSVALTDGEGDQDGAVVTGAVRPTPRIETSYYSDEAYPFSEADRGDLLDGYSLYGCEWQGNHEQSDSALSIEGIDDLYAAIAELEARLLNSSEPSLEEIRAGSLGACYLSVLLHQAVRAGIEKNGLPRPLCVMAGNNGVYPYFDAPVMSSEEYRRGSSAAPDEADEPYASLEAEESDAETAASAEGDYRSLLSIQTRRAKKMPVLVLEGAEADNKARMDEMATAQQLAHADGRSPLDALPETAGHAFAESVDPVDEEGYEVDYLDVAPGFGDSEDPSSGDAYEPIWPDDGFPDGDYPAKREEEEDALPPPAAPEHAWWTDDDDPALPDADASIPIPPEEDPAEPAPPAPAVERDPWSGVQRETAADLPPLAGERLPEWPFEEEPEPAPQPATFVTPEVAPVSPQPAPAPAPAPERHGHHLRARIAQVPETRVTLADVLVAWLGWIGEKLARLARRKPRG